MPVTLTARSLLIAGGLIALALAIWVSTADAPANAATAAYLAPVLAAFAAYKGAIALDAGLQLRPADTPAAERLIAHHGSRAAVRAWIAYKAVAAAIAILATIYCLTRLL